MRVHGKVASAALVMLWLVGCGGGGSGTGGADNGDPAVAAADFSRMVSWATTSATTGAVTGTVTDTSGNPVAGATVTVTTSAARQNGGSFSTQCDRSGQFAIGNMTVGLYDLAALHEAVGEGQVQVQVRAGQVRGNVRPQCRPGGQGPGHGEFAGQGGPIVDGGVIVGLVQDVDGHPIPRSRLSINNRMHAATGELGAFAFGPLPAGSYTVGCRADGFVGTEQTAEVVAGQATELLFILEAGEDGSVDVFPASLLGTVFDAVTEAPIAGAEVVLSDGRATTTTGADGTFTFDPVRPGGHLFGVRADGYRPVAFPIRLVPGAELTIRVPLSPSPADETETGNLIVQVVDAASGDGLPGAQVSIDDRPPFHADRNGRLEVGNVPVGSHSLVAWARGHVRALATADIVAGETTELSMALDISQNGGGDEAIGPRE